MNRFPLYALLSTVYSEIMGCPSKALITSLSLFALSSTLAPAQPYGQPDQTEPGDAMIQDFLRQETAEIHGQFLAEVNSPEAWNAHRAQYQEEYFYMLGLWPLPEKTPLRATTTGSYTGDGFIVDNLHYQSRPRLYVTANLYRPANQAAGERLPAVLYVCGHSNRGRNGNKTAYQSHGIWLARHGYVCLMVDTLQLGEIAAIHHGTYREERWWWHSYGYTPAGVECWNGVRGIDYLISRPDVDPDRIAVTGISGGGAATFWIAAADERARVAVPVSGMADLPSYVSNRVINGHCDCMFLYNTFQWPWTRIAALIAPRPMLFVNSDHDGIFPMDANDRVINRLERVYRFFGAGDLVDSLVSMGGHAYRQDIRQAAFRFINTHLKNDPRPVADSEQYLVTGTGDSRQHPIPPEALRVFPDDADLPSDELNTTIDQHFVPVATVETPTRTGYNGWRDELTTELRRVCFRSFPDRIPPARLTSEDAYGVAWIETEPGIKARLVRLPRGNSQSGRGRVLLEIATPRPAGSTVDPPTALRESAEWIYRLETRGTGATRWTQKNPPNYVERSFALLGRTVDAGRVWDVIAAARLIKSRHGDGAYVCASGTGTAAVLGAYAALWEDDIAEVIVREPPVSHRHASAPQILNVLRVCDVPQVLGMLAPRPLTILNAEPELGETVKVIYEAAGAHDNCQVRDTP